MTELTRFAALGRGKGMEEDGGRGEAQAILEREAPDLARRFSWRSVEPFINKMVTSFPTLVLYHVGSFLCSN